MNAVDTNVLLYYVDQDEPARQARATALLARLAQSGVPTLLLSQVAVEFAAGLTRWMQNRLHDMAPDASLSVRQLSNGHGLKPCSGPGHDIGGGALSAEFGGHVFHVGVDVRKEVLVTGA
jgi:hypothetical protein